MRGRPGEIVVEARRLLSSAATRHHQRAALDEALQLASLRTEAHVDIHLPMSPASIRSFRRALRRAGPTLAEAVAVARPLEQLRIRRVSRSEGHRARVLARAASGVREARHRRRCGGECPPGSDAPETRLESAESRFVEAFDDEDPIPF